MKDRTGGGIRNTILRLSTRVTVISAGMVRSDSTSHFQVHTIAQVPLSVLTTPGTPSSHMSIGDESNDEAGEGAPS